MTSTVSTPWTRVVVITFGEVSSSLAVTYTQYRDSLSTSGHAAHFAADGGSATPPLAHDAAFAPSGSEVVVTVAVAFVAAAATANVPHATTPAYDAAITSAAVGPGEGGESVVRGIAM